GPPRARADGDARLAPAPQRPLRAHRLREDILPRLEERPGHLRAARHRSERLHGPGAARSICRAHPAPRCLFRAFGVPRLLHASAEVNALPPAAAIVTARINPAGDELSPGRCYLA